MKIKPKIQLAFLLAAALPMVVSGWLAYSIAKTDLTTRVLEQVDAFCTLQKERVRTLIAQNAERLALVSSRTQLRVNLWKFLEQPGEDLRADMARILVDARDSIDEFKEISLVDIDGVVLVSTDPSREGEDVSREEFYLKGVQESRADTFVPGGEEAGLTVFLSGPMFLRGEKLGVVVIESTGERFLELARSSAGLGESAETLLAKSGPGGESLFLTPGQPVSGRRFAADGSSTGGRPMDRALLGEEKVFLDAVDNRGDRVIAATRFIPDAGLGLVVKVHRHEALAPIEWFRALGLTVFLLMLGLTAIMSGIVARSITRPIHNLAETAGTIAEGDLARRAEVSGGDEIGMLARDFNRMAEKLSEVTRGLEQRVAERTAELKREVEAGRSAQQALAASEERFRQLSENIAEVFWMTSVEGDRMLYVSPAYEKIWGRSCQSLYDRPENWIEAIHPEDRDHVAETFFRMAAKGGFDEEYRLLRPDGSMRWIRDRAFPVRDAEGEVYRIAGIARDITKRREAEEELRRSNADLEQFAYVASHDLREPLRMVSSYVQLLSDRFRGKLDAEADEFIGFAQDGARRMQNLISDLLAYSRVGMRGKSLKTVSFDAAVDAALDNLKVALEESGAEITRDPLPEVEGDFSQLTQLMQNLLANAIRFNEKRPPRIHLSSRKMGHRWEFSVADNGIGIEAAHRDKIFLIFQRLHSREQYEGTGIGLALCRRIVERHGGEIRVESEPGEGTTFFFTLGAASEPPV